MSEKARSDFAGPGPDAVYRANLAAGKLALQICAACGGKAVFPPRALCPRCGSTELSWRGASGAGTVYSATVGRDRPEDGGDRNNAAVDPRQGAALLRRAAGMPR